MKIVVVVGARPNFMKVAPLVEVLAAIRASRSDLSYALVHTGQHYNAQMSQAFFEDLNLPVPDFNLGVGSGTHAEQTGKVMIAFEQLLLQHRPDWVVVVGDVNSTMACAIAAKKLGIRVAHVEAGLRSRDRTMPEEINRVLTDSISDALFTTERSAAENLIKEGISVEKIHFVGNVMIDALLKHLERARALAYWKRLGLESRCYATLTLHRPANVDDREVFFAIAEALAIAARDLPIVFPLHPRTRKAAVEFGLLKRMQSINGLHLLEPLGYLAMLSLNTSARAILTDSGGIQEEAAVLKVPCITLRNSTERLVTIEIGANRLAGTDPLAIVRELRAVLQNGHGHFQTPEKWDGHAAHRIAEVLLSL
jgi:UDP-N-acetylglucosamine 2-epimerase (non-hydrolysing)